MPFVETVAEADAAGDVAVLYGRLSQNGPLPNWARLFSLKPALLDGWLALLAAVKADHDPRRYELATLGAARALRSSYCMLAHGKVLLDTGMDPDILREIGETGGSAALSPAEQAIVAYADKIARDASAITQDDLDGLRAAGLSDAEIFDAAAAAAARCFFSKLLDALGARPDAAFRDMAEPLRGALTPGREIDG